VSQGSVRAVGTAQGQGETTMKFMNNVPGVFLAVLSFAMLFAGCSDKKKKPIPPPPHTAATVTATHASAGNPITVSIDNGGASNRAWVVMREINNQTNVLQRQEGVTDANGDLTFPWSIVPSQIREPRSTIKYELVVTIEDTASTASTKPTQEYVPSGFATLTTGNDSATPAGHAGDKVRGLINTAITLQGESWVPNGDSVTHAWTLLTANVPGTVTWSSQTTLNPTVTLSEAATITVRRTDTNTVTTATATFDVTVSAGHFLMNASSSDSGAAADLRVPTGGGTASQPDYSVLSTGGASGSETLAVLAGNQVIPVDNMAGTTVDDVLLLSRGAPSQGTMEALKRDANPYPISVVSQSSSTAGQFQLTIICDNGDVQSAVLSFQSEGTTGYLSLTSTDDSASWLTGRTFTVTGLPTGLRGTLRVQLSDGTSTGLEYERSLIETLDTASANITVTKTAGLLVQVGS